MRRTDFILLALMLAFGTFVAVEVFKTRTSPMMHAAAAAKNAPETEASPAGDVVVSPTALPAPSRNLDAIRTHLLTHQSGTFIGEILAARDSNIARWIDRRDKPVRVWIDERSPLAGPDQALPTNVRRAFSDWSVAGVPLVFTFVDDSSRADVKVTFVDHFDRLMSGRTLWTRDRNWWILGGDIQLSLRSGSGRLLGPEQLYAIALHEVGHLLGLDHTADTLAIMTPRVRALALTPADIATMRLIYEVPPGSVKAIAR